MTLVSFPCQQCGAKLEYVPGTTSLECPYCGQHTAINTKNAAIEELDYDTYTSNTSAEDHAPEVAIVKCLTCGATTRLTNTRTEICPFCGSTLINTTSCRLIQPQALLPFATDRKAAMASFKKWLSSLWFAPNDLKYFTYTECNCFNAVYLPFWTYDAETTSHYTGERGEHYWETETYTTTKDGKTVTRTREVRRTRWHPASGVVNNDFDDLLIVASRSLGPSFERIPGTWNLQHLVPYQEDYLSGFHAESYQVSLEEGFQSAQHLMVDPIRNRICCDIGGDEHRIHSVKTDYDNVTFKHILLPLWICAYRYQDRVYRILINGCTGEITGERPWSWIKIMLLVLVILTIIGIIYYFNSHAS